MRRASSRTLFTLEAFACSKQFDFFREYLFNILAGDKSWLCLVLGAVAEGMVVASVSYSVCRASNKLSVFTSYTSFAHSIPAGSEPSFRFYQAFRHPAPDNKF